MYIYEYIISPGESEGGEVINLNFTRLYGMRLLWVRL